MRLRREITSATPLPLRIGVTGQALTVQEDGHSVDAVAISRRALLTFDAATGLPQGEHWIRVHRRIMACRFEVVLPDANAAHVELARRALDEADRQERTLSVFREDSAVTFLNRTASRRPVAAGRELFRLLTLCRDLSERTEGAFDITSTPLSRCWGFLRRAGRVPDPEALETARSSVGMPGVELQEAGRSVRFRHGGTELNFGAIGKGHALDRMTALLRPGVRHALLAAGGSSIFAMGGGADGWRIDIRSRRVAKGTLARVRLRDAALGTSGAGEQYVDADGVRYGHVIDPRTGWPAAGVVSATVICDRAAIADALSTAFLVGGIDLAARYCAAHARTMAILVPDDGTEEALLYGHHPGAMLEAAA